MKEVGKRRQKRMDKFENEKDLISLWKKKIKLMDGKLALNKVELPKPERAGYVRTFVLRDDFAKSKEANFLNGLLKLVQTSVVSRDKKFEYKDYKTKTKKPIYQGLHEIDQKEWNKLIEKGLTEKQQSYFERRWKNNRLNKGGYWAWEFTKPFMFVYKVQPHYITHRIMIDPALDSELQELSNRIERQNLYPKIGKILGWRRWKDYEDLKKKIIDKENVKLLAEGLIHFIERYDEYDEE